MRNLGILALLAFTLAGTVNPVTIADITGDGSAHALGTGAARWVQFVATTGNGAAVRVGDSAVSTSRGIPIAAGAGWMMPPNAPDSKKAANEEFYDLSTIYYLAQTGDKLSVVYAK